MIGAALATLFFAISAVTARRSVSYVGAAAANFWRQLLALALLGGYAHLWGKGLGGGVVGWFLLSGFIGYGIGDFAIFRALPLLGSRLAVLMTQCLAAPFGALTEWLWLGTHLEAIEGACGAIILLGVALALTPEKSEAAKARITAAGVFFGVLAAAGQAGGAVISRHAFEIAGRAGIELDGITASYQRILAGVVFGGVWYLLSRRRTPGTERLTTTQHSRSRAWPWIVINGLAGPTLGVSCYQWAIRTEKTGVVLAIVALTPLAIIPLSMWLERERPTRRSLIGGLIAVAATILLAVTKHPPGPVPVHEHPEPAVHEARQPVLQPLLVGVDIVDERLDVVAVR